MTFVRPKKKAPPKGQTQAAPAQAFSFPAPIRGLVLNEGLATPSLGGALVLDNWICTTTGIKVRGGTSRHIPVVDPVKSLFVYRSGPFENAFAATETDIYSVTSPSATAPAAVVSGRTNGVYFTAPFSTAGGDFLYAVNGTDDPLLYDGSTFTAINGASSPAITGVTASDLTHVWSFANRIFFVEKDSVNCWYLPIDSIGGAAQSFSLAGIFQRGGKLLFGATWSLDAGDGLDDKCVFVSDQGEVAIYEGTNPGSAADWRKAGVYNITKPLGPKAIMQAGGDLLVATQAGLVSIAQAIQRDTAALEVSSVTKTITPLWQRKGFELGAGNWEIEKWASENVIIVSQPGDIENTCLVCNLQTGGWSRFTGLNVQTLAYFDGSVFFGGVDGNVYRFESGGNDNGESYTCRMLGQHDEMGVGGLQKTIAQMRPTFRLSGEVDPYIGVAVDYEAVTSPPPNASPDAVLSYWGVAVWGASKWGDGEATRTYSRWAAIGRTGYAIAPELQITIGGVAKPNIELVGIDATFHVGGLVT